MMAARGIGDAWLPSSLEAARITSLPSTAYYLPNFISEEEERLILDRVRCCVVAMTGAVVQPR